MPQHRAIVVPKIEQTGLYDFGLQGAGTKKAEEPVEVYVADPNLGRPAIYHSGPGDTEYAPRLLSPGEEQGLNRPRRVVYHYQSNPILRYGTAAIFMLLLMAVLGAFAYAYLVKALFEGVDGDEALQDLIEGLKPKSIKEAEARARKDQAELAAKAKARDVSDHLWFFANGALTISLLSIITAIGIANQHRVGRIVQGRLLDRFQEKKDKQAVAMATFFVLAFISFGITTAWSSFVKGAGDIGKMAEFHFLNFISFVLVLLLLPSILYAAMTDQKSVFSPQVIAMMGFATLLFAVMNIGYGAFLMMQYSSEYLWKNTPYFYILLVFLMTVYVSLLSLFFYKYIWPYIVMP